MTAAQTQLLLRTATASVGATLTAASGAARIVGGGRGSAPHHAATSARAVSRQGWTSSRSMYTSAFRLQQASRAEGGLSHDSGHGQMHHGAGSKSTSSSSPSSLSGTQDSASSRARRSMLYVPGSSEKMIKKSQNSTADTIIFDLEDSVAAHKKASARETVLLALEAAARPGPELSVRINPPSGDKTLAGDDLDLLLTSRQLQTIVVPKVEHEDDIRFILDKVKAIRDKDHGTISLVLSIESAASLLRMPTIIEAVRSQSQNQSDSAAKPLIEISALLFASEDYCASTGILRTSDRRSLLFPRAHMATIAKACNLSAIDMVCIEYKDLDYLHEETQEAKELGYDGKQAIHPAQVETIQSIFNPSEQQIRRAARIKHLYTLAEKNDKGAYGLKDGDRLIMIDAPMLLQAEAILGKAKAAGLEIPDVSNEAD